MIKTVNGNMVTLELEDMRSSNFKSNHRGKQNWEKRELQHIVFYQI